MALVLADRVKETTTTAGTGTVTLLGASAGFQSFAVIGNANTTYYTIAAQTGTEWEVGIGTYTLSGTTLARTTVLSNSAGTQPTALTFSAGTKDVFVTYPSGKSVNLDASGNATALGTPAAFVGTNITGTASGLTAGNVTTNANLTGDVTSVGNATAIAAGVIVNADINASAGIVDTKLATISTALKVSNSATTATNANTASAIVARDASGNFSAGTITAALTGTASGNLVSGGALGTPSSGTLTNCTFPTLNQNTTGSAATLTTARAIYGNNFDGSAALTQVIASTYGGTGNGFTKFTGAATAEKTYTLPDATTTILTTNAAVTVGQGGTGQTSYTNGQLLIGNTTGNTLTKATLTAGTGISITNGTGSISIAATGGGTVTSVAASVPAFLSISGSPITTSGTLAIGLSGTALPIANGGTGQTTADLAGAALGAVGVGQTWSNVTASRAASTTYTNSTGRPIQVAILSNQTTNAQFKFYISGTLVWDQFSSTIYGDNVSVNFIIPATVTYQLVVPYGAITYWMELR